MNGYKGNQDHIVFSVLLVLHDVRGDAEESGNTVAERYI